MSAQARYTCDGCCTATVDIPMPDGRALVRLIEALHAAGWSMVLPGTFLCPACAAVTELGGAQDSTEAMF